MISVFSQIDFEMCSSNVSKEVDLLINDCKLNLKRNKELLGHAQLAWRCNFIVCQSLNWLLAL